MMKTTIVLFKNPFTCIRSRIRISFVNVLNQGLKFSRANISLLDMHSLAIYKSVLSKSITPIVDIVKISHLTISTNFIIFWSQNLSMYILSYCHGSLLRAVEMPLGQSLFNSYITNIAKHEI